MTQPNERKQGVQIPSNSAAKSTRLIYSEFFAPIEKYPAFFASMGIAAKSVRLKRMTKFFTREAWKKTGRGILMGCAFSASSAFALPTYFEFGGAASIASEPSPLFQALNKSAAPSTSSIFAVPMTFGLQLQDSTRGLLFSIALQGRYFSGKTSNGESFSMVAPSPVFRVEFWKLVLGAGYSTFVFRGLSGGSAPEIKSNLTLEAQFLFPITPEIDFGLQAARQSFSTSYDAGPPPASTSIMQYGAFFRLNFGMSTAALTERKKFKGWRYPFGVRLR